MQEFTFEIETVNGIADSAYLDRLADLVYSMDALVDPLLGLNENGSVSASFSIVAETTPEAAERGVALLSEALARARPLAEAAIGSISVERATVPSMP
jgi:hypothetical protein